MRILRILSLAALLLVFCLPLYASTIVYTFKVVDDSGVPVAGATLAQNTVKSLASTTLGNAVAGLTLTPVDLGNGDYGLPYDPEGASGEIIVNFAASKAGSTLTGQNASISVNLTKDSSRVLNADVATSTRNSGAVQVGSYATNQDPGFLVWGATTRSLTDKSGFALATTPPSLAQITALFPAQFANLVVDGQGRVTTSNPATQGGTGLSNTDITNVVNAIFAAPAYGNLTFKQLQGLNAAMMQDADRTYNATTHTAVSTWYARTLQGVIDKTRPVVVKTTVYDSADKQPVSQTTTLTPSNLY